MSGRLGQIPPCACSTGRAKQQTGWQQSRSLPLALASLLGWMYTHEVYCCRPVPVGVTNVKARQDTVDTLVRRTDVGLYGKDTSSQYHIRLAGYFARHAWGQGKVDQRGRHTAGHSFPPSLCEPSNLIFRACRFQRGLLCLLFVRYALSLPWSSPALVASAPMQCE